MRSMDRRRFLIGSASALLSSSALAQSGHAGHGDAYERLNKPGRIGLPEAAATQHVFDSPARKAASPGRWAASSAPWS